MRDAGGNSGSTTQPRRAAADVRGGAVVIGVQGSAGELAVVRGDKGGTGTGDRIEDDVVLQMEYRARY